MKKRLFGFFLSLCLLMALLPAPVFAARAPISHSPIHCLCGSHKSSPGHSDYEEVDFRTPGTTTTDDTADVATLYDGPSGSSRYSFPTLNRITQDVAKDVRNFVLKSDITVEGDYNATWSVPTGEPIVICLYGYNIICKDTDQACAIIVPDGATLILVDCTIAGDKGSVIGDGSLPIMVREGGTLKLYGVGITAPEATALWNFGTVEMYDSGNYWKNPQYPSTHSTTTNIRDSKLGIQNHGTFKMFGGEITGNSRGIWSEPINNNPNNTVEIVGGRVSNNGLAIDTRWSNISVGTDKSTVEFKNNTSGAFRIANGANVTIGNATITGNGSYQDQMGGAGAVFFGRNADSLTLTGNVNITGNTGANLYVDNIYSKKAVALNQLSSSARIGVSAYDDYYPFTESSSEDYTGCFISDDPQFGIGRTSSGALQLQPTYSVTVQAGTGGTASSSPSRCIAGTQVTLSARPNDHYSFKEWQVVSGSAAISNNRFSMPASNVTVKAIFQPENYPVTYAPGANGTGSSQTDSKYYEVPLTLKGAIFTRVGYTQVGWATSEGGEQVYDLSGSYTANEAVTLYPVWQENSSYTIHVLNRDGSKVFDIENVKWNDNIRDHLQSEPVPTREGYRFYDYKYGDAASSNGLLPNITYGELAPNGEDSITLYTTWRFGTAKPNTLSIGEHRWNAYHEEVDTIYLKGNETVSLIIDYPDEMHCVAYAVKETLYPSSEVGNKVFPPSTTTNYNAPFQIDTLNLKEGTPYYIYSYILNEGSHYAVTNSDKIIIDKTAPVIAGIDDGKVYCGTEGKTITVSDLYLDTVTVNGSAVTPNAKGEIVLSAAADAQTIIASDKAGNTTEATVTIHGSHNYQWKTENGSYWGECADCGDITEKKPIPVITIQSPDTVCSTQDFTFSFNLPEGCTDPSYGYEFVYTGDGKPVTATDGVCTGTIPASSYAKDESSFRFIAYASTADGYRFSVSKDISIQAHHTGGTATCTKQAVCTVCHAEYGELNADNHTGTAKWTITEKTHEKKYDCCGAVVVEKSAHVYDDGKDTTCNDCGYERTIAHEHVYGDWSKDAENHWHVCTDPSCPDPTGSVKDKAPHSYDDDKDTTCNDCGYERTIVSPVVNPFKDIKESDWCYDDIMYVYEQGLMVGIKSDTFSPNLSLTRGMMATIIWRMEGSPAPTAAAAFRDVPSGMWCADAIAWTAENNIFLGYADRSFKPNVNITRQQLVTILYRYADYRGEDMTASGDISGFRDLDQVAPWAKTPMQWAVGNGIIKGLTTTTLAPQNTATRAQVAAILHRFLS